LSARLVRTVSGGSFAADILPADVVARCERCRVTIREGDWYCDHLEARYGHRTALLADRYGTSTPAGAAPATVGQVPLAAVFLAPLLGAVSA
jgi:hypothetical protein